MCAPYSLEWREYLSFQLKLFKFGGHKNTNMSIFNSKQYITMDQLIYLFMCTPHIKQKFIRLYIYLVRIYMSKCCYFLENHIHLAPVFILSFRLVNMLGRITYINRTWAQSGCRCSKVQDKEAVLSWWAFLSSRACVPL